MSHSHFKYPVPKLTVMVDYGESPFLWMAEGPEDGIVGLNICSGIEWCETYPLSKGLWHHFALWATTFDFTEFYSELFDDTHWDWPAFHARGLYLTHLLKLEVGDSYKVVYAKPFEDPNEAIESYREVMADGSLIEVTPQSATDPVRHCFFSHIISGGQTGADRAALDFAIKNRYTHGGWAPRGRKAEDGRIPAKYQLSELDSGGYRQRTRRNVEDSGGTLIINIGVLDGGSLQTKQFAESSVKPLLVVQLDNGVSESTVSAVRNWLTTNEIKRLNIAGPRESKRPGIQRATSDLLMAIKGSV